MTPILGALVLAAVVALLFFTRSGRQLFEDFCDGLDERLLVFSNIRQRRRERGRASLPTATHKREVWR